MKRVLLAGLCVALLGGGVALAGGREAPPRPPTSEVRGGGTISVPPIRHEAPLGPRDPRHPEPPAPAR